MSETTNETKAAPVGRVTWWGFGRRWYGTATGEIHDEGLDEYAIVDPDEREAWGTRLVLLSHVHPATEREEQLWRERNAIGEAIAHAALRAGIYNGEVALTGPDLILLTQNIAEEIARLRARDEEWQRATRVDDPSRVHERNVRLCSYDGANLPQIGDEVDACWMCDGIVKVPEDAPASAGDTP